MIGVALLVCGFVIGLCVRPVVEGVRAGAFNRQFGTTPLPPATCRSMRRARRARRLNISAAMLVSLAIGACTQPNLETCELARTQSYELQPPFACRIEQWPEGATVYPIKGGADFVQLLDGGAAYVGPAQYDTVLREPGVLAALLDGDCEWLLCHGGVPPVDAGVGE